MLNRSALDLLDEVGIDDRTVRKLAERLNVAPGAPPIPPAACRPSATMNSTPGST